MREGQGLSVIKPLSIQDAAPVAAPLSERRPLKVGVLVDLALTAEAGGHVKCWQRLAEAAIGYGGRLDLTVHFNGPEPRRSYESVRPSGVTSVSVTAAVPRRPDLGPRGRS